MATTSTKSGKENGAARTPEDLAADIEQLKADIAKLTELLQETGQHSYGAARRAASEGVEQLRAQGEAAIGEFAGKRQRPRAADHATPCAKSR